MTLTGKWKDILPLVKVLLDAGYGMSGEDIDIVEPNDERGMRFTIYKATPIDGR